MDIGAGLFDGMVMQRNSRNRSDAAFGGTCRTTGVVTARVTRNGRTVAGFAAAPVGRAARGKFSGRLAGLAVGGPYEVELTVADATGKSRERLRVADVLVGDVWLLGGQSNMEGCGKRKDRAKPHPMVRAFYMTDRWGVAEDPIHTLFSAVDWVHNHGVKMPDPGLTGVGPGAAFGQELHRLSGVPQGLIACAHGGTSMSQWSPVGKRAGGKTLYGAMCRRLKKNGGRVAGVAWYQGCSDAIASEAKLYTSRMKALVAASRRDCGDAKLPWVAVQIARVAFAGPKAMPWNAVQEQQRRLPQAIKRLTMVPTIDLELEDAIHISGVANQRLGKRMACAMWAMLHGRKAGLPPIKFRKAFVREDGCVEVVYDHVAGALQAPGRAIGFALIDAQGVSRVYRTDLDGHRAILRGAGAPPETRAMKLYYGYGLNPDCNITDAADRSLPVMGPIALERPRALTPFVTASR